MTLNSQVWLVCLPEEAGQTIAARLAATTGLSVKRLESLEDALTALAGETPRLAIANGELSPTARLKLYGALQDHAAGGEIPVVFVDHEPTGSAIELVGAPSVVVDHGATADDVASVVRNVYAAPVISEASYSAVATSDTPVLASWATGGAAGQSSPAAVSTVGPAREPNAIEQVLGALARRWWLALAVLATVMAADVFYTMTREKTYLARASLIISPSANVDRGSLVYSVDSLGRGRIVGTYAEVLGSELVHREALERLGQPATALGTTVNFKSSTVADTAVVQVTAESPDPELSAQAANFAGEVGIERMTGLFPVYNLVFLSRASAPLTAYRPDPMRNYSVGLLIGIILATVIAYAADTAARKLAGQPSRQPAQARRRPAKEQKRSPLAEKPTSGDGTAGTKRSWFGRKAVSGAVPQPATAMAVAPGAPVTPSLVAETPITETVRLPAQNATATSTSSASGILGLFRKRPTVTPVESPRPPMAESNAHAANSETSPVSKQDRPEKKSLLGSLFKRREPARAARGKESSDARDGSSRLARVMAASQLGSRTGDSERADDSLGRGTSAAA